MCKFHIEQYSPPDKTKSPTSITTEIKKDLESKREARISFSQDPFIADTIHLISLNNIKNSINTLCSFQNRHSKSQYVNQAADWLYAELNNLGYNNEEIYFHNYSHDGYDLKNVICNRKGSADDTILLCAHYDTILKKDIEDITSRAPGANDNASGVAALLEIARIVSKLNLKRKVQFAFFSGEEQGLWGSTHYAQYVKENNMKVYVVVNMDMCGQTGFLSTPRTANIDIDDGQTGVSLSNNEASKNFGLKMESLADIYTNIDIEFDPIDASDYMPFEARNYVCIGAYDGSAKPNNPHYHSDTDVISNLDLEFLTEVTKMVLAFLLSEAK